MLVFCIPIAFDNPVIFFSDKKYSITIQTRKTTIVMRMKPSFKSDFKNVFVQKLNYL